MPERIKWIDSVKGIAMLLVIFGHTYSLSSNYREIIYSFHMPLFFILSGYTFLFSSNLTTFYEKVKKNFIRLYLPVLIVFLITLFFKALSNIEIINQDFIINALKTLLYSSGINFDRNGEFIAELGYSWFLVSLFEIKIFYDFLNLKFSKIMLYIILFFLFYIGLDCTISKTYLVLNLDVTLMVFPFFMFGIYLSTLDNKKMIFLNPIINLVIWTLIFLYILVQDSRIELAAREYSIIPLGYICGISGSIFMFWLCKKFASIKHLNNLLTYVGKHSLLLLCVHCLDFVYEALWNITNNETLNGIIRFIIDLVIVCILLKILEFIKMKKLTI